MSIEIKEALKKVDEYLSQAETLLTASYKEGQDEGKQLFTKIKNFVRITFSDGKAKLEDFRFPIDVSIGGREKPEGEKQEEYIGKVKVIKNHLLAYKDELQLRLASKEKSSKIDRIEEETQISDAEARRRSAVVESKLWGAVIELLDMQRDEIKKRDDLTKQIIELQKEVRNLSVTLSTILTDLQSIRQI